MDLCRTIEGMNINPTGRPQAIIVSTLPPAGAPGYIYLVPDGESYQVWAYEDSEWKAKSGGSGMIVNMSISGQQAVLDKTWKEINDVVVSGGVVYIRMENPGPPAVGTYFMVTGTTHQGDDTFVVSMAMQIEDQAFASFLATSEDGYPTMDQ